MSPKKRVTYSNIWFVKKNNQENQREASTPLFRPWSQSITNSLKNNICGNMNPTSGQMYHSKPGPETNQGFHQ